MFFNSKTDFKARAARHGIRIRLTAGYAFAIVVSAFVMAGLVRGSVERFWISELRGELTREVDAGVAYLGSHELKPEEISEYVSKRLAKGESRYRYFFALFDREGRVLARSGDFEEDDASVLKILKQNPDSGQSYSYRERFLKSAQGRRLLLGTRVFEDHAGKQYFLQLALSDDSLEGVTRALTGAFLKTIPWLLVLALAGGWYFSSRALKPIDELSRRARAINGIQDLKQKLPVSGAGNEIDEMALAINGLLSRLEEAYARIVRFTSDASHELRLPITAIKGEAEVVLERERSLEEYRRVLASIIEEFDRLMQMIARLLSLSRQDSGEDPLKKEETDIGSLVYEITEFYKPLAEEKRISLAFTDSVHAHLNLDRGRIEELVSNLLDNAIKYTPESGSVTVKVSSSEGGVEVSVQDTGIGIPEELQSKVFERFFRVDTARSRKQGGAGLGLSIAQAIAQAHGGSLRLHSRPGQGSTFILRLPFSPPSPQH